MNPSGPGPHRPAGAVPGAAALVVLVVDDDPLLRELGVRLLQSLGHRAEAVGDGEQAVQAVRSGDYDAVLIDYDMPHRDGVSATRGIRRMGGKFATLPIIMVSGRNDALSMSQARAAGVDAYFVKPLRIGVLREALGEFARRAV